jgi:hypothetical protein
MVMCAYCKQPTHNLYTRGVLTCPALIKKEQEKIQQLVTNIENHVQCINSVDIITEDHMSFTMQYFRQILFAYENRYINTEWFDTVFSMYNICIQQYLITMHDFASLALSFSSINVIKWIVRENKQLANIHELIDQSKTQYSYQSNTENENICLYLLLDSVYNQYK